jgi:hypothetical protein
MNFDLNQVLSVDTHKFENEQNLKQAIFSWAYISADI